ncbi:MAG: Lrp/AsnC family transcriptional regulator [Candidatus Bathyarchaeia archaeon]
MVEPVPRSLDDVDIKILNLLEEDGSLSFADLSRRLNTSESMVRKRVNALREMGVIKKFSVVVDPAALGLTSTAILGIDVDPPLLLQVAQKIGDIHEVKYVALTTGDHMIMVEVWARSSAELSKVLSEKIGRIDGVKKICPSIVLERLKG